MPVFAWEGRTRQGQLKKGVIEAASEAAAMMQLRAQADRSDRGQAKAARTRDQLNLFKSGREDAGARRSSRASSRR